MFCLLCDSMTSVLKKSKGSKGKSESMQEDLPARWGEDSRGEKTEDVAKLVRYIDDSIVGKGNSFCGPYGRRKGQSRNIFLAQVA